MALTPFNKKLLNFLYELTKQDKYYSDRELAKRIVLENNEKITAKTVRRWLNYAQTFCFDYYPKIHYEQLGLVMTLVFTDYNVQLINRLLFQTYAAVLIDVERKQNMLVINYLVPTEHKQAFEACWEQLKNNKEITTYSIFYAHTPLTLYNRFDRCIDEKGNFVEGEKQQEQVKGVVLHHLKHLPEIVLSSEVKKNPFLLPVTFEYDQDNWTSTKVWDEMYKNLHAAVWKYMKKGAEQSRNSGIKRVQGALKTLSSLGMIHQMKLTYMPFEEKNLHLWAIIRATQEELADSISSIFPLTLETRIYAGTSDRYLCTFLVNKVGINAILDCLIGRECLEKIFFINKEKSQELWKREFLKFKYYDHFDPVKKEWQVEDFFITKEK